MDREDAFEGQRVRIKPDAKEHYAGQEGTIIQIWPHPAYQWYDWALVDVSPEDCVYVLFEDLEPTDDTKITCYIGKVHIYI